MTPVERALLIVERLSKVYEIPRTCLAHETPFELLVATVLSAQSTDEQVNRITATLFKKYRHLRDYADAPPEEFQSDVSSVNFYKNKARYIQASARLILHRHGGAVPRSMAELVELPGVARKTANIILSGAFGINEGIAVDTHVKRLSGLLGLSIETDPVRIERDLMGMVPRERWADLSHYLIFHGRAVCKARRPMHAGCVLNDICPSSGA